ncbi:MAG: hypothetical protein AB1894_20195 [Chloroflexota bacterium]
MRHQNRSRLVVGVLLILLGGWFLLQQVVPGLRIWVEDFSWPMIIIAVGVFLLLFGLLVGAPGMAVPAAVVGGIGGLLYWQNATDNWTSWAYAWTLIPGFAGVGVLLSGLLGEHPRQSLREGLNLIVISAVMFIIMTAITGENEWLGPYWPLILIAFGVWLLLRALLYKRKV